MNHEPLTSKRFNAKLLKQWMINTSIFHLQYKKFVTALFHFKGKIPEVNYQFKFKVKNNFVILKGQQNSQLNEATSLPK